MKTTFKLLLFLPFLWSCSRSGPQTNIAENELQQAMVAFKEVKEALKEDNGQMWNYSLDGPILLVDRESRVIIANENDDAGKLKKQGTVYTGLLPQQINIANTAIDWNGKRWTMVAFPLPDKKEERMNLLIHELFHRIQPVIGFDSLYDILSVHLDSQEGRIYLKLELEALKKACESSDPGIHIKNALLFRQYRYQLFPEAKVAENSLEINEGLAEYTGAILSGRSDGELKNHFTAKITDFYENPTFVRSFAYYTLPVYGYFIHQSDRKWNLRTDRNTILTDYLMEFYQVNPKNIAYEEVKLTGKEYGMESITELETQRELRYLALIEKYRTAFQQEGVLKINLVNMNIGFNPGNIMPLDTLGTVYPNLRITDNWGVLEVDSCGALISPDWNMVTISYPIVMNDTLISGKGWRLHPNSDWKLEKKDKSYWLVNK